MSDIARRLRLIDIRLDREPAGAVQAELLALSSEVQAVETMVNEQADDEALWARAGTAPEAYLQRALRRLHAVIEGESV